ncbi:MAG: PorT family protein [Bacteroidales bacterium]|jgi:hypothetical protein|nr:PorT family protein [Bacteroidales bacterium]
MRRVLFIFILLVHFIVSYSQNSDYKNSLFHGGIRAGITASQISGDDLGGFHKLGGYTGVFVNVPLEPKRNWYVQAEINFIMKGSSSYTRGNRDDVPTNYYKLNLFYIETPLIAKYCFSKILKGVQIEFGPTLNFLAGYTEKGFDYSSIKEQRRAFRIVELAGLIGVSYFFKEHWGINFRFTNSIIPVRIPNWGVNRGLPLQFNTVMAINMFYQF